MNVQTVKQLEDDLAAARESARAAFLETIEQNLKQLHQIGFEYHVSENGAAPKQGRPRKESNGGEAKAS